MNASKGGLFEDCVSGDQFCFWLGCALHVYKWCFLVSFFFVKLFSLNWRTSTDFFTNFTEIIKWCFHYTKFSKIRFCVVYKFCVVSCAKQLLDFQYNNLVACGLRCRVCPIRSITCQRVFALMHCIPGGVPIITVCGQVWVCMVTIFVCSQVLVESRRGQLVTPNTCGHTLLPGGWPVDMHSFLVAMSYFMNKNPSINNHRIFIYTCQVYSFETTNHKLNPGFCFSNFFYALQFLSYH